MTLSFFASPGEYPNRIARTDSSPRSSPPQPARLHWRRGHADRSRRLSLSCSGVTERKHQPGQGALKQGRHATGAGGRILFASISLNDGKTGTLSRPAFVGVRSRIVDRGPFACPSRQSALPQGLFRPIHFALSGSWAGGCAVSPASVSERKPETLS